MMFFFAQTFILEKTRKQLLKNLWTFGRYGELKEENDGSHLILTSEIYADQKIGGDLTISALKTIR